MIKEFIRQVLQEDFESFMSELQDNAAGLKDYESGYDYEAAGEISRRPEYRKSEFKPKAVWLKSLWNKHVDRQFIQSLDKVHWLNRLQHFSSDLQSKSLTSHPMKTVIWELERFFDTTPKNAELSTTGILPDRELASTWGSVGILVDGRVTFAGNHMDIVWSGDAPSLVWKDFKAVPREKMPRRPGRFISTDFVRSNKAYILDRESYDEKFSGQNELIVAHWKPLSIVFPRENWEQLAPKWRKKMIELATDNGCNIIDEHRQKLSITKK